MAVASGALAYTGSYTVDEKTKIIHPTVMMATFPIWSGPTKQTGGDGNLRRGNDVFTNPRTATGAVLDVRLEEGPGRRR